MSSFQEAAANSLPTDSSSPSQDQVAGSGIDSFRQAIDVLVREQQSFQQQSSQWEFERLELLSRISVLERELKNQERVKVDLAKRVKMLEFALKEERSYRISNPPQEAASTSASTSFPSSSSSSMSESSSPVHTQDVKSSLVSSNTNMPEPPKSFDPIITDAASVHSKTSQFPPEASGSSHSIIIERASSLSQIASSSSDTSTEFTSPQTAAITPVTDSSSASESIPLTLAELSFLVSTYAPTHSLSSTVVSGASLSSSSASPSSSAAAVPNWRSASLLRSHVDGVRSVCFHATEPWLITASEDGTAKAWNIGSTIKAVRSGSVDELKNFEAFYTYRGHRGPLLSCAVNEELGLVATGGFDCRIGLWNLPNPKQELYGAFGSVGYLRASPFLEKAHTDAIWSLVMHPHMPLLFSASADGSFASHKLDRDEFPQMGSWRFPNSDSIPTSLCLPGLYASTLLVGSSTGHLMQFDFATEKPVRVLGLEGASADTQLSRILSVAAHPHLPIAISAHEDETIRLYDLNAGACIHTMRAHADSVTSVCVDSSSASGGAGRHLLSAGHDSTLRTWDLATMRCLHDMAEHQTHRKKYDEGIHSIAIHKSTGLMASGGADSIARLYYSI